jgi:hypothetical protein
MDDKVEILNFEKSIELFHHGIAIDGRRKTSPSERSTKTVGRGKHNVN